MKNSFVVASAIGADKRHDFLFRWRVVQAHPYVPLVSKRNVSADLAIVKKKSFRVGYSSHLRPEWACLEIGIGYWD